ncbi:hypothetical protein J437_LFUL017246 [Ladona fulva]|uniref:Integrase zinc-binding domain-containing protein n=1 Tax=Ladona fulva TaxID=123851 RepID=A0A8K0PB02_LADFU|nr:hypothetical protein J437_LFUL017246 [Ladona fulva]
MTFPNLKNFAVSSLTMRFDSPAIVTTPIQGVKIPTNDRVDINIDPTNDLLTGADTLEGAMPIRDKIIDLLKRGGFDIRQWASNHHHVLDNIHEKIFDLDCAVQEEPIFKTLGVTWNSHLDKFFFSVNSTMASERVTKRSILSKIARNFDPLGLLGPVTLVAKIFMQDCWKAGVDWDESVPQNLHSKWTAYVKQLELVHDLAIDRCILIRNPKRIEIHGFCDASDVGYGACLYIRSINSQGHTLIRLSCSKARVAPLKKATIPRLELCGAQVLAHLYSEARSSLIFQIDKIIFWSDSTIVLQWLKKPSQKLPQFEADALSRGQSPAEFIQNQSWFNGPSWLTKPECEWPQSLEINVSELPVPPKNSVFLTSNKTYEIVTSDLFSRFSSYSDMLKNHLYHNNPVVPDEINYAERNVIKLIQREQYLEDIHCLLKNRPVSSSKLAAFNPFLDEHGILCVGGRLLNSKVPSDQKTPILLPSRHYVTDLIIRETHLRTNHFGIRGTLATLRQQFWLFDGKNQVRNVIRQCVTCIRHRPVPLQAQMGNLPKSRVEASHAFDHTGVDFFSPISIKEKKYRNTKTLKAYGCVFICMVTKALWILSSVSDKVVLLSFVINLENLRV